MSRVIYRMIQPVRDRNERPNYVPTVGRVVPGSSLLSFPMTNATAATPTSPVRLETIDDVLLGVYGALLPPSARVDHAVRYLSTWSGSE